MMADCLNRSLAFLIVLVGILSGSLIAQSRVFYVSPSGNDLNSGLLTSVPFQTIARGINSASAGDTVYLLPGVYRELVKILQRKGIAEQPLCIYGYSQPSGQRPIIDGGATAPSNTNTTNYWMDIENSDWIEVGNIEFRNGWTNPIQVINSSYVTFNGCVFYGGKRVIAAAGTKTHHLLIQNCYWDQGGDSLWRLVTDPAGTDAWTSMHEGTLQYYNGSLIHMSGTGGSIVIRNNTVVNAFNGIRWTALNNYDTNIEIYDNSISNIRDNDFEPETFTFNLHIYHNRSHNIHKTMSVDHVRGGFIYYYGNRITSENDSWSNQISTSFWKVYGAGTNNLSYPMYAFNNSFCGVGKVFPMDAGTIAVQLKHFNNAYYITGNRTWMLDSVDSTVVFDFDISNKSWPSNISARNNERNGQVADIQFVSTTSFDLRLKPTSPGIDKGTVLSFPELGWTQSYRGSAPDVGAYEGEDLLEGPPFRFRTVPGTVLTYVEKPRIVRATVAANVISFSFSEAIDPSTISAASVTLVQNGVPLDVVRVSLSDNNYRLNLVVDPGRAVNDQALKVGFDPLPKGVNGESATLWAATLPSYKKPIVVTAVEAGTSLRRSNPVPELSLYPSPLQSGSRMSVRIPSSVAESGIALLRIYDVLGRSLVERSVSPLHGATEIVIDTETLAAGTYFMLVQAGNQSISKKFVVLR